MTHFKVEYHSNGILRSKFEVRANACKGLMEIPDFESVCKELPHYLWAAIQRGSWWEDKYFPSLPMRLDMVSKQGKPLGTLFATKID